MPKPLNDTQFQTLVGFPESPNTPARAASILLAELKGDDKEAEGVLWTTWNLVVGGDPSSREKGSDTRPEATFLVRMIEAIADGAEEPQVTEHAGRRRAIQAWRNRSSSYRVAA